MLRLVILYIEFCDFENGCALNERLFDNFCCFAVQSDYFCT